ncbi:MAG: lipoprotein-releasing system transmembrane subunit LolC [Rhodospirillaceae bacterium]|nr:lipoprotein-releasing system transmembrane subunit LolC [Rhodospirillaceae bacterium]
MRKPYEIYIALRYLRAHGKGGFVSFISMVSMCGIGLAVSVLLIVLSVMNGFESELQNRILSIMSHATVSGIDEPLDDWPILRERALERSDVMAVSPYIDGQGLAMVGEEISGVRVRGIEPHLEQEVSTISDLVKEGSIDGLQSGSFKALIGRSLAEQLGISVGDSLVLILADGRVTPAGIIPRMRTLEVSGIFEVGMYEYDHGLLYIHLEDASRLFSTSGDATGLRLTVSNVYEAGRISEEFAVDLGGGVYISDWTRQHSNFFRSIQITKSIMFIILSMVIAVAVFNIVSTLMMVVRDKRSDIAILQSFGANVRSILILFATQGTMIGVIGTVIGLVFGILVSAGLGNIVGFIEYLFNITLLSEEIYFMSELPTEIRMIEVFQIGVLAILLTIVATLYPAISASKQPPVKALRHE